MICVSHRCIQRLNLQMHSWIGSGLMPSMTIITLVRINEIIIYRSKTSLLWIYTLPLIAEQTKTSRLKELISTIQVGDLSHSRCDDGYGQQLIWIICINSPRTLHRKAIFGE